MESLAALVAVLFLISIVSGPIAIGIARIQVQSILARLIKRLIQGVFIFLGVAIGGIWLTNPDLPMAAHLLGLFSLVMSYYGIRNEYFPKFKLLSYIFPSRSNGRSNGNDGHGPGGQH